MIEFYRTRKKGDIIAVNRAVSMRNLGFAVFWAVNTAYGEKAVKDGYMSQEVINQYCYAISAADALQHNGRVYARAVLTWSGYPIRHTI